MIALPPFVVRAPLARGAMGEVWRGEHPGTGQPVAIKLLSPDRVRRRVHREAFRREVEAVAGLHHRGIVRVYDHGRVGPEASAASEGALAEGASYLVMELAARGSLAQQPLPADWHQVRAVLLEILEAVGHAHARGVLHRDLKPANVLVRDTGALVVADFGVADVGAARAERAAGTPLYMAPEQFRGSWREQGPWTDLYAIGAMAWELVTGAPPFVTEALAALRRAHLQQEPPPLAPRVAVPAEAEGWLRWLLDKDPLARPELAADAAHELSRLGGPTIPAVRGGAAPVVGSSTWDTLAASTFEPLDGEAGTLARATVAPVSRKLPPMPAVGRSVAVDAPLPVGAGLGLYGIRAVPLVGREAEQDRLWAALADVRSSGRLGLAVLRGPEGYGKSRVAGWLAERALEVGAATVLRAGFAALDGPAHGLCAMVSRALRATDRAAAERALARWIPDPEQRSALAALVEGTSGRHHLLRSLLAAIGAGRPVVLLLEDAQHGEELPELLDLLVATRDVWPVPALVVLTVGDEPLDARRRAWVARLQALPWAVTLPIGPLDPDARRRLVRNLLGLSGALAAQVEERTAGNPQFATQLVGDWIRRGVLALGEGGFRLAAGEQAELPADLGEVWRARLERIGAGPGLVAAACLGLEVDAEEWAEACGALDAVDEELVERLVRERLARRTARGFTFAHAVLPEVIRERARGDGTLAAAHLACARALERREQAPCREERLGLHLLGAGEPARGLPLLLAGAKRRFDAGRPREALWLLDRWLEAYARAGVTDPEQLAEVRIRRAMHLADTYELETAGGEVQSLLPELQGPMRVRAIRVLAHVALRQGQLGAARAHWLTLLDTTERADRLQALRGLASVAVYAGDADEAGRLWQEVLDLIGPHGQPFLRSAALNGLGEVARLRGDLDAAERCYREALPLVEAMDEGHAPDAWLARLNLALVALHRRDWAAARAVLDGAEEGTERDAAVFASVVVLACLLPCHAAAEDWPRWDAAMSRLAPLLAATGAVEPDLAWALALGGDVAAERGDRARAAAAWALAIAQRQRLGSTEQVEALERRRSEA